MTTLKNTDEKKTYNIIECYAVNDHGERLCKTMYGTVEEAKKEWTKALSNNPYYVFYISILNNDGSKTIVEII